MVIVKCVVHVYCVFYLYLIKVEVVYIVTWIYGEYNVCNK